MPIKNKDGTPYSYNQRPNPIMTTQTIWPKDEPVYLHNKIGKRYFKNKLQEVIKPTKVLEVDIVKTIDETPMKKQYPNEEIYEIWCLPCISFKTVDDPLYGSSFGKVTYGEKFLFEGRIIELEDLYIQIMTENKEVTEKSILFPKIKGKRWWKVSHTTNTEDGQLIVAMISDYQPSFSD